MALPLATDPRASDYEDGIYYPSGDGKPMAETPIHGEAMVRLQQALESWLRDRRPDVYVGRDMFWYWQQGDNQAYRAPDVFVALNVAEPTARRRSFRAWHEGGVVPAVIFEMASENTWRENRDEKRELYERLGVKEYFIFDPEREYFDGTAVLGWRLVGEHYEDVLAEDGRWTSQELGVWLEPQGQLLRLRDPITQELVLLPEEERDAAREQAEREAKAKQRERTQKEAARKQAAEERQRAEEERQQKEAAQKQAAEQKQLAEAERQQKEHAQKQAEEQKKRAEEAEAELARLRRLLGDRP